MAYTDSRTTTQVGTVYPVQTGNLISCYEWSSVRQISPASLAPTTTVNAPDPRVTDASGQMSNAADERPIACIRHPHPYSIQHSSSSYEGIVHLASGVESYGHNSRVIISFQVL